MSFFSSGWTQSKMKPNRGQESGWAESEIIGHKWEKMECFHVQSATENN